MALGSNPANLYVWQDVRIRFAVREGRVDLGAIRPPMGATRSGAVGHSEEDCEQQKRRT